VVDLVFSIRARLLDSFSWLEAFFVHESPSIGQFLLIDSPFCPREPFYWTIFTDWLPILSTRALLLDNFYWLDAFFVHENRSIGQFLLIEPFFCPWKPFYWTIFADWLPILSMRALLLDSFSWLEAFFVHENPSIGQFLLIDSPFCPREPFYWTISPDCLLILSMRTLLLDNFY
jgi:hypothetical protein